MSEQKKKNNVVVLIIIIVLVVAIGGYAVFDSQNKNDITAEITTTQETTIVKPTETTTTTKATTVNYKEKYLKLLNDYENRYGEACNSYVTYFSDMIVGLCYAELIDFNADGIDELLIVYKEDGAYNTYNYEIWTYKDGSLKNVDSGQPILSNGGYPHIAITTVGNKKYFVTGEYADFLYYHFREFKGEKFVEVKSLNNEFSDPNELKKWTKNLEVFFINNNASECKAKINLVKSNCNDY